MDAVDYETRERFELEDIGWMLRGYAVSADLARRWPTARRMFEVAVRPDGTTRLLARVEPAEVTA